jgi:hypothetical protein
MGTLKGFPNRRAKPARAYAILGTLKRFASPLGPAGKAGALPTRLQHLALGHCLAHLAQGLLL